MQSVHLDELLIGHTISLLFYLKRVSKRGQNYEISHIRKVYRICICLSNFDVEWIVLSAFGSMSRHFLSSFTEQQSFFLYISQTLMGYN